MNKIMTSIYHLTKKNGARLLRHYRDLKYWLSLSSGQRILRKDIKQISLLPKSYPTHVTIALSNECNYACPICSIHNLRRNKVVKVTNNIQLDQIKAFSDLFDHIEHLAFMGLFGESILNPEFIPIVKYIKTNHPHIHLFVSTNGYGITEAIQNTMIDIGFDSVNFSIHASKSTTYKKLQGPHFDIVLENLTNLQKKKDIRGADKPRITIVYALNKANIDETKEMVDIAYNLGVDNLDLYHYHDYGIKTLSLNLDIDFANKRIDEIYAYAEEKNARSLLPTPPPYFIEPSFEDREQDQEEIPCYLPWKGLQLRASYSHPNSLYMGCYNVFNAFLFDYQEHFDHYEKIEFKKIWHHPVLQYVRRTVNSTEEYQRNPFCTYCKSTKRHYLKKLDNHKNVENKLRVLDEFFKDFKAFHGFDMEEIVGLEVLYTEDHELRSLA